jgi:hypothetical protein
MEPFGFIILRHVSMHIHNNYWKECIKCVRKYHDEKIIVIDDNSKMNISNDINYNNVTFVSSEYKGAGEILGYYYAWKYKPFESFIVLHDSMFLNYKLPKLEQKTIFLWHFDKYLGKNITDVDITNDTNLLFINYCKETERKKMLDIYYDKSKWVGCFGVASIASLDFVNTLFEKYDFESCIKNVKVRHDREAMERVYAILAFLEEPKLHVNKSLFGNILIDYKNAYFYKYNNYINDKYNYKMIKIWSGR